ncbi:MAG: hypothetical protein DID89_2727546587 [Candidatus Nitrotoga sp. CP45]|nr:MAG: hypothetical protein DID89_2727546587 [Candidatus Nitrotoga sp. CP45]
MIQRNYLWLLGGCHVVLVFQGKDYNLLLPEFLTLTQIVMSLIKCQLGHN